MAVLNRYSFLPVVKSLAGGKLISDRIFFDISSFQIEQC